MSQNAAISSFEGLELQPSLMTRLNFGIETISGLAISVPQDLFQHCGITDERSALDLVMRAKKLLIRSGTVVQDFSTADDLLERRFQLQDLVVTKKLGQGIDRYRSLFPHVSAAIQLAKEGKSTAVGEGVEYIFTNAGHINPLYRVIPTGLIEQKQNFDYDKEKYRDMLLEAAETLLGYFGFDRALYGDSPKPKKRKWWYELRNWRIQDIENERIQK